MRGSDDEFRIGCSIDISTVRLSRFDFVLIGVGVRLPCDVFVSLEVGEFAMRLSDRSVNGGSTEGRHVSDVPAKVKKTCK